MSYDKDRIIYQLTVEDLQTVALDFLERELSPEEIVVLEDLVGKYVPWYNSIWLAIHEMASQIDKKLQS